MIAPRWRKVLTDARVARGRLVLLATAMTFSIIAVTALLVAEGVLSRELPRSFLDTSPASAILRMDATNDDLVALVRAREGIQAAEAGAAMAFKINTRDGQSLTLQLRVIADFHSLSIDRFALTSGASAPPPGTMLLERSGLELLGFGTGERVVIESFFGETQQLAISGLVHDETQPPSTQEMTIYGYITPATMRLLDEKQNLNRLKIIVAKREPTTADIEAIARPLAVWLRDRGHRVSLVEIPPPGEHPHQWQYETIAYLLLGFSLLGLVLESLLLAIVVTGVLAPQIRQIAVMKALGARSTQIASMYLGLIGTLALASVLIGIPAGVIVGRMLVDFVAAFVNVGIESYAISAWILVACGALGVGIPLGAAFMPVWTASRRSIRASLDDHGLASGQTTTLRGLRLGNVDTIVRLAMCAALRQRRRFALTATLLAFAGIVFIVGGNMLSVWQNVSTAANEQRGYDLQFFLREPLGRERLQTLESIDGVEHAEPIDALSAFVDRGDGISVAGVGRSSFSIRFVPEDAATIRPEVVAGRWLRAEDIDAIVINTTVRDAIFPSVRVGDAISVLLDARPTELTVVGLVREPLSAGTGYATHALFDRLSEQAGHSRGVRVAVRTPHVNADVAKRVEAALNAAGAQVGYISRRETMQRAEEQHVYVIVALLGLIVSATAVVGAAGLSAALGTSVVQRTREIGIMRAIGARSAHIYKSVLSEAVAIAALSWLAAVLLAIPLTALLVELLRQLAFQPLTFSWSPAALAAWLAIVICVSLLASTLPARRAAQLSVGKAMRQS